jgi:uncharacterized protein (TIGR02001 family)
MKKTILSAIASLAAITVSSAAIDVTTAYTSDYYFRGTQLANDIVEAAVDFSEGDFYAGIWTAQPINDGPGGAEIQNEIDFYTGIGISVTETFALDLGITAYVYPELDEGDQETYEFFVGGALDVVLSPALYFYYDETLETWTTEISASYGVELAKGALDFGVSFGNVSPDGGDSAVYYLGSVSYSYSGFSATLSYTDGDDELVGGNWDDGIYFSLGFSAGF